MRKLFLLPKITNLLLIIFLIGLGVSCKDQKTQKSQLDQIENLEDDESFAGSSKRNDICELLTKSDIRSVFELSDNLEIKQAETKDAICTYKWETSGEIDKFYSVSLNFARGKKRSNSQIDTVWESQNESVYKKHDLLDISDVGDKASWSKLGGGQLRVAANGYIFYVSHSVMVMPGEDKAEDVQGMIDKTSALAKRVIERM